MAKKTKPPQAEQIAKAVVSDRLKDKQPISTEKQRDEATIEEDVIDLLMDFQAAREKERRKYNVAPHYALILCSEDLPRPPEVSELKDAEVEERWANYLECLDQHVSPFTEENKWIYVVSDLKGPTRIIMFYSPLTKLWSVCCGKFVDMPAMHGLKGMVPGSPSFSELYPDVHAMIEE